MIDFKYLLRKAYFQTLNGSLTFNSINVPVYDDIMWLGNSDNLYVLMTQNSSTDRSTQQSFSSEEEFQIQIVQLGTKVNKQVLDNVANQIFSKVLPYPNQLNGLSQQPGVLIDNLYKLSDLYDSFKEANSKNVVRRIITFSQLVTQTNQLPIPRIGEFMLKFTSADFSDATTVNDSVLAGLDIAVFFNDINRYLNPSEFTNPPSGGFTVLIPGFDSGDADFTFYVSILSN